jgi:tetratricopeptide (TPR) repeat protein
MLGVFLMGMEGNAPDFVQARFWLERGSKGENADPDAMWALGLIYKEGKGVPKNLTEARKWFKMAADRGQEDARRELGQPPRPARAGGEPPPDRQNCTGNPNTNFDRQISSCTALIQSDRETTETQAAAYNNRGIAYAAKGDTELAIADFNEAIRLNPGFAGTYLNRGKTYALKGNYDLAVNDLTEAVRLDSRYTESYVSRGYVFEQKGDNASAIADYRKALSIDPSYQWVKDELKRLGASE